MGLASVQFAVATHIMTVLADRMNEQVNSAFLAESVNAPPTFVRKSVSKLVKAGLVKAIRGKHGYCTLSRPACAITLAEVYRASDSPAIFAAHTYPVLQTCRCSVHMPHIMASILLEAEAGVEQVLSRITLADLLAEVRGAGI